MITKKNSKGRDEKNKNERDENILAEWFNQYFFLCIVHSLKKEE